MDVMFEPILMVASFHSMLSSVICSLYICIGLGVENAWSNDVLVAY
jgi:hypothetical protein